MQVFKVKIELNGRLEKAKILEKVLSDFAKEKNGFLIPVRLSYYEDLMAKYSGVVIEAEFHIQKVDIEEIISLIKSKKIKGIEIIEVVEEKLFSKKKLIKNGNMI